MKEYKPGAHGDHHTGRGRDFTDQGGHSPTVPEQGRLVTACSISCPVTIRQGEITSWVQGPSRKFSQKQKEAGLEVRLWIVLGSSRKFSQQVRVTGGRAVPTLRTT